MSKSDSSETSSVADKVFGGRYHLQEKLGAGGMGAVYRAYDDVLKKTVAVKLLLPNLQAAAMIRFHQEAKATARLKHKNILTVLDFGQSESGELYLVMDYLDGQSLQDLLKANGAIEPALAVPIFIQICSGMQHAHSLGILHRDIKPSNVMLVDDGRGFMLAKIVDFGLAKMETEGAQSLTTTGARIGSPLYMSPEQCNGQEVDHRSDIYSIGILMYRTLTGKVPFQGESFLDTLSKHMHEEPRDINENERDLSFGEDLSRIVSRALEKDPAARHQCCEELRAELASLDLQPIKPSEPVPEKIPSDTVSGALRKGAAVKLGLAVSVFAACFVAASMFIAKKLEAPPEQEVTNKPAKEDKSLFDEYLGDQFTAYEEDGHKWVKIAITCDDDSLPDIAKKTDSKRMNFTGAQITGKNLDVLSNRPIEELDLTRTFVSDDAMPKVAMMSGLRGLWLNGDDISDKGINAISSLKHLKELGLQSTDITDQSLQTISEMEGLERLDIGFCDKITSRGLKELTHLKSLQTVHLPQCEGLKASDIESFKGATGIQTIDTVVNYHPKRANWQAGYFKRRDKTSVVQWQGLHWWEDLQDPEVRAFFKGRKNFNLSKKEIAGLKNPRIKKYFTDPKYMAALKEEKFRDAISNPADQHRAHAMQDLFSHSIVDRDSLLEPKNGSKKHTSDVLDNLFDK